LPATALLAIYAFEPFNFMLPLFGMVDDFLILPLVLHVLLSLLPGDIRDAFERGALA
jgi:uncharacterized membrane protein YkvA (DUF1232 family)